MIDENIVKKYLEPTVYLKDNIGFFIDAFVEYYGEEYRNLIENKFHNINIFAYQKDTDLQNKLNELESKYGEEIIRSRFKKYYEYLEENQNLKYDLFQKYNREYVKRIKSLLPEKYHELIDKYIESEDGLFIFGKKNNCPELSKILGNLDSISIYEYFTPEMDAKLSNPETADYEKNVILRNRKEYFDLIGINIENQKLDNPSLKIYYPSQEMITEIIKTRNEIKDTYILEFVTKKYPNNLFKHESDELGLLCDNTEELAQIEIEEEFDCVRPNLIKNDNLIELYPELIVYVGENNPKRDLVIIHELNHILEMQLINIFGNKAEIKTGWDYTDLTIGERKTSINSNRITRKYERFSEVINELLAMDIYKIFQKNNVFSNQNQKENTKCEYLDQEYIVKDFFEKYKKEIIESRITGNIEIIINAVGKESFEELNNLINEDYSEFSWITREQLQEDLKRKEDTYLTRKYYSIVNRKEMIIQRMNEHYAANNIEEQIEAKTGK